LPCLVLSCLALRCGVEVYRRPESMGVDGMEWNGMDGWVCVLIDSILNNFLISIIKVSAKIR
jgi:hypothetical protein